MPAQATTVGLVAGSRRARGRCLGYHGAMKAMQYRAYGGPDVLELNDVPDPVPGAGQILIRARAASVNPVDWKMASGKLRLFIPARFPQTPGFDVAGEVAALGPGVTAFRVGDRVHARLDGGVGGAAAELTLAALPYVARVPEGMDFATAAGLPLAGMTALQGLRDRAGMPMSGARQRVLVVGASGGVGHLGVQISRAAGAEVIGVCSARNRELVAGLGAEQVIDYNQPDPYRGLAPVDIVLDCVGGAPGRWLALIAPGGRFLSVLPGAGVFLRSAINVLSGKKVYAVLLKANAADLSVLDRLWGEGKLKVVVADRFPLSELRAAWARSIEGRAAGKIIIDIA